MSPDSIASVIADLSSGTDTPALIAISARVSLSSDAALAVRISEPCFSSLRSFITFCADLASPVKTLRASRTDLTGPVAATLAPPIFFIAAHISLAGTVTSPVGK